MVVLKALEKNTLCPWIFFLFETDNEWRNLIFFSFSFDPVLDPENSTSNEKKNSRKNANTLNNKNKCQTLVCYFFLDKRKICHAIKVATHNSPTANSNEFHFYTQDILTTANHASKEYTQTKNKRDRKKERRREEKRKGKHGTDCKSIGLELQKSVSWMSSVSFSP